MKTLFLTLSLLFISIFCLAQTPQALNYQAVARTALGQIIPAQNVAVRFSIIDVSISGTIIYQETHTTTTNNFGLFTLAIGKGTVVNGTFVGINWGTGDKFLKVEIAADGSNNYQLQGTTQLLSVPYALYAEKTRLIAGNAISIINGNTIAANYQPGIGINITGSTISGNYVGGAGVNVTGNTISGNYVAGTGVSITGNVISAPANTNYWIPDANGIHSSVPHVGIGLNSNSVFPLHVRQPSFGGNGGSIAYFESDDSWMGSIAIKNNLSGAQYTFAVGGPTNTEFGTNNFALFNHVALKHSLDITGVDNYVGIGGSPGANTIPLLPKSRLHVFFGDVNIDQIGSGIIMKSPNGACWRVTLDNAGNLIRTAITCP